MSVEQIIEVPENGQLTIQLPAFFKEGKKVKVVIDEVVDEREAKLSLLRQAVNDPLFIADMKEINNDFDEIESRIDG